MENIGLNILPTQPINNIPGANLRPVGGNLGWVGSVSNRLKSAFDNLDVDAIGKGRLMTEGSYHKQFGTRRYSGLKGQLEKMQLAGRRGITKNLSQGNIEQIHDLIAGRLKKKAVGSQTYFSRGDKMAILKESRKLAKTAGSQFTYEDRKDLIKTVNTLQQKYKDIILHRDITTSPLTEPPPASLDKNDIIADEPLLPSEPELDSSTVAPDIRNN